MNDLPDDLEFDPAGGEDEASDPDTNLILDYLSNKLDSKDVQQLEDRARRDKAFRYKLADIVLLKGLVMLALEKNPGPAARECRQVQRLFLDYLKGKTSVKKTAVLSRHLEDCFECELAFERFQEQPSEAPKAERGGWGGFWRRIIRPGRPLAVTAIVAVALAAGAFGVAGFLTSAGRPASRGASAPGETAQPDGLVLRPGEVLSSLKELTAAQPGLDANHELSNLVKEILDGTRSPVERSDRYTRLAKEFGPRVRPLLWILAANEPDHDARATAYGMLYPSTSEDVPALIAAARREIQSSCDLASVVLPMLCDQRTDEARAFLRSLFPADEPRNDVRWATIFFQVYGSMKQDPTFERQMTALLADRSDTVRSFGVIASSQAGNDSVLPMAVDLLQSNEPQAQLNAAVVIARRGTREQIDQLVARPWARRSDVRAMIAPLLRVKGIELPQNY